ncbi:MAG: radical SAM protein [Leptospiraceae bacterium]|nr:radical SAM protein [Leptospiraceae bacterium]
MEENYSQLARRIQSYLKDLRNKSEAEREEFSVDRPVCTEVRHARYNGDLVQKLIIFLRGTGCSSIELNGGCTFCGFYSATNHGIKLNRSNFLNQLQFAFDLHKKELDRFPIISLYNDGSMLSEQEISLDVTLEMIQTLSSFQNLKLITTESKLQDITEEKILRIKNTTNKELELSFGFESSDPVVRRLCINKNFTNNKVIEVSELLRAHNINCTALLMLKPPFLSEQESIDDAVKSLQFLEETEINRIDIELPTVEAFTLSHELWKQELYKPIKLWSVIEILKHRHALNLKKIIYVSPANYTVKAIATSSNCPLCNDKFSNLFMEYNQTNDISVFDNLTCECKHDWNQRLIPSSLEQLPLADRVEKMMDMLEDKTRSPLSIFESLEKKDNATQEEVVNFQQVVEVNKNGWDF